MSEPQQQRIAREEEYWTAPKLFGAGFLFLGVAILVIYAMATLSFSLTSG